MVTVLITSFLLLAAIVYAVYWWQQPSSRSAHEDHILPPPASGWVGLFAEEAANQKQLTSAEETIDRERGRAELLMRAARGERDVLGLARETGNAKLYDEVLNALLSRTDSDKQLLALVSFMLRETPPLGVNRTLAERVMQSWKAAPDRGSTAKMLHIAALANDASLYRRAIETALELWREGRIHGLAAQELRTLCESEYWILSQPERSSGQGFLLKLKLATLRRATTRRPSAQE
jgi:hypothetical protein